MTYTSFQADFERGKEIEKLIDDYYSNRFDKIETVTLAEEKNDGIDRRFFYKDANFTVEYKGDFKSAVTGNVFIELSVTSLNTGIIKEGWAVKTKADIIMIYAGGNSNRGLYLIKNEYLKKGLIEWQETFPIRDTIISQSPTSRWNAQGVCVPLIEFGKYCFKFIPENKLRGT